MVRAKMPSGVLSQVEQIEAYGQNFACVGYLRVINKYKNSYYVFDHKDRDTEISSACVLAKTDARL